MKINCYKTHPLCIASLLALSVVVSVKGDVIADWTFQTAASTNNIIGAGLTPSATQSGVLADIGTGTASASHATATTAWSIPAGNGSTNSWSANNWTVGDYFQFQASSLGFYGISVSYDQTGSGTGPRDFGLFYSTDGSAFTQFGGNYAVLLNGGAPNASWNGGTVQPAYSVGFNLSGLPALDNVLAIYFRVVDMSATSIAGATVGTGGTDRLDNFSINGTVVPEPGSVALVGMGMLVVSLLRRKL